MLARALRAFNAYRAHPDAPTAAANTLALVLAYNGPCYPVYLYLLVGRAAWPSLIPMWVVPAYALIPALSRRYPTTGRLVMIGLSVANTALYTLLFGARAQLQLFMLPCIALGLLLPRRLGLAVAAIPLGAFILLRHHAHAIIAFTSAQYSAMAALSEISVATLTWFLLLLFSGMMQTPPLGRAFPTPPRIG